MYSRLVIAVEDSHIEFTGNFELDAPLVALLRQWFQALPDASAQVRIDAMALKLKAHNDGLAQVVSTAPQGTTAVKE